MRSTVSKAVIGWSMQALSVTEDVIHTMNDQMDNILHANLTAIKTARFLALGSKQPSQLEEFAALQSKTVERQAESVATR